MNKIRSANIDVTKIDKTRLFEGKPRQDGSVSKYLSLDFIFNRDGVDERGNAGFVTQSPTKEERQNKVRMPIIGNFKVWEENGSPVRSSGPRPAAKDDGDFVPF